MTTATQTAVTKAAQEDAPALARTLARAFADDPVTVWFLPREPDRPQRLRRAYERIFLRRIALPREATFTVAGTPASRCHCRPGGRSSERSSSCGCRGRWPAPWAATSRARRGMSAMDAVHPHEPHWYLWLLGVDPQWQGEGLGSRLLAEVLERCDRDRVPAYLQATTPRNRELYLRHGFEDCGELRLPDDGPRLWPMRREAGA
jgi:ribosomal protein S18 acetylase RimI-like enzyme